jgi:hypothetical protein
LKEPFKNLTKTKEQRKNYSSSNKNKHRKDLTRLKPFFRRKRELTES